MNEKKRLITVRKGYPQHRFDDGGLVFPWAGLALKDFKANPWDYSLDYLYGKGPSVTEQYMNSSGNNWFGLSKKNNPFSKGNLSTTGNGLIGASADLVGNFAYNKISGGLKSGAGSAVSTIGDTLGGAIGTVNPALGGIVKLAGNVVGGTLNRAIGSKINQEKVNKIEANTTAAMNSDFSADSGRGLLDAYNNSEKLAGFTKGDVGKDGWFANKAKKKYRALQKQYDYAQQQQASNLNLATNNLNNNMIFNQLANMSAFGGPLDGVDVSSPIGYSFMNEYINSKLKLNDNGMTNLFAGIPSTMFDIGGTLQTKGSNFTDGITHINAGDSHENNRYDGVLIGTDNEGTPNLVEEGEVIFNDYVYSNRLTIPDFKKQYKNKKDAPYEALVLWNYSGKTFADAAKKIEKSTGADERVADKIANDGMEAYLSILAGVQEKEREKEKLREQLEVIDNMTPEEFVAMQQQLELQQQLQEAMQLEAEQQAMQEQLMQGQPSEEELAMMQLLAAQQLMMQQQAIQGLPMAAYGGQLNNTFALGGITDGPEGKIYTRKVGNATITYTPYYDNEEDNLRALNSGGLGYYHIVDPDNGWDFNIRNGLLRDGGSELLDVKGTHPEGFDSLNRIYAHPDTSTPANVEKANKYRETVDSLLAPYGLKFGRELEWQNKKSLDTVSVKAHGGKLFAKGGYKGTSKDFVQELEKLGLSWLDYIDFLINSDNLSEAEKVYLDQYTYSENNRVYLPDEFDNGIIGRHKEWAELFLNSLNTKEKEVARLYRKSGKDPKKLTGAALQKYKEDVALASRNPELLTNDINNQLFVNQVGKGNNLTFSRLANNAVVKNARQAFFGNPLEVGANNKFAVPYNLPEGQTPQGYGLIKDMWTYGANGWQDAKGNKVDNPFGDNSKFSLINNGTGGQFANLEELSKYYQDAITNRFKTIKGDNYDANRLAKYYLSKDELNSWITDLESSESPKDKALALMLRNNWNLDAENLIESDAYLGLDAVKNNKLQRDAKPGIEHIPYINAVTPYASRFQLLDNEGSPLAGLFIDYTGNYGENTNPLYHINWDTPLNTQGGVTTYGVTAGNLNPHVAVVNGKYYILTPEQAQLFSKYKVDAEKAKSYTGFNTPIAGYNINPTYYEIPEEGLTAAGLGTLINDKNTAKNDDFPTAPTWPYLLGAGIQGAALAYNWLKPIDYSNSDAMLKAAQDAGKYQAIGFRPVGEYLRYNPFDINYTANQLRASERAAARDIINTANGNIGAIQAGLLANNYNNQIALGNAYRQALEYNDAQRAKTAEFNRGTDQFNSEGFLKADMANQEAASKARGYTLEGTKAGLAMKQAVEDAKSNAISAGISGLANSAYNYAQSKYNQDVIDWMLAHGQYPISLMKGSKYVSYANNGGTIKRKKHKGLGF